MLTSVAPATGGLTLRAWTMPGSFTSTAHFSEPSTLAGMSSRGGDWPTCFSSCTGLRLARPATEFTSSPDSVTLNRRSPMSSP